MKCSIYYCAPEALVDYGHVPRFRQTMTIFGTACCFYASILNMMTLLTLHIPFDYQILSIFCSKQPVVQ
jgi:hypothetical protein